MDEEEGRKGLVREYRASSGKKGIEEPAGLYAEAERVLRVATARQQKWLAMTHWESSTYVMNTLRLRVTPAGQNRRILTAGELNQWQNPWR